MSELPGAEIAPLNGQLPFACDHLPFAGQLAVLDGVCSGVQCHGGTNVFRNPVEHIADFEIVGVGSEDEMFFAL